MENYWSEFLLIALAHLLAVASPGPDFAVVLRQSLHHGTRTALWTSLGIGTAILLHVTYSLFGLGLLIRSSAGWFLAVKFAGAAYLAWLGFQALRVPPRSALTATNSAPLPLPSIGQAFLTGFLTNALNPKATLFFLSLYAMMVSPQTPRWVQAIYGGWMSATTMAWFCLVSLLFTRPAVRSQFLRHGHWVDRTLGVVLLGFAGQLACATLR